MVVNIEYVGGPDDGHQTTYVGKLKGSPDRLPAPSNVLDAKGEYRKTDRLTAQGRSVYQWTP